MQLSDNCLFSKCMYSLDELHLQLQHQLAIGDMLSLFDQIYGEQWIGKNGNDSLLYNMH